MVDDLLDKLETRNEKWEIITCQYSFLFLKFLFGSNIIMVSHIKNLLKQLPFYGKTINQELKIY